MNPVKKLLLTLLTILLLALGGNGCVRGFGKPVRMKADLVVTTLDDAVDETDGLLSLREAIAQAAKGDRIGFDDSLAKGDRTIRLKEGELEIGKPLTIDAESVGGITIDAGGKSMVFLIAELPFNFQTIARGRDELVVELNGLTVTGGTGQGTERENPGGGGIFNAGKLTVRNSVIKGNSGGIVNCYANLTLINTVVSGNTSKFGGGVLNGDGNLTVINSTIAGNRAEISGGGIDNSKTLTLINSIVACNSAKFDNDIHSIHPFTNENNIIGIDPGFAVPPVFEEDKLTNADTLDLTLAPRSAAIDRGTNDAVKTETDCAGTPRIYAALKEPATVDIGAYEYQKRIEQGAKETPSTIVTTNADIIDETDGMISLREAVLYAQEGETVTFDAALSGQTIALAGSPVMIDKSLTIDASGTEGITLDGQGQCQVLHIEGKTENIETKLIGFAVKNGKASQGGGIFNTGKLSASKMTIEGNSARNGGGIYSTGELELDSSAVTGNSATGTTGGILIHIDYDIKQEQEDARRNGGFPQRKERISTIRNTTISNNTSESFGGGLSTDGAGILRIEKSVIADNSITGEHGGGGGIAAFGNIKVFDSVISGNSAPGGQFNGGGGIQNVSNMELTNTKVINNIGNNGGGIDNVDHLILTNTIIAGNKAYNSGGGIANHLNWVKAFNSDITGNTADLSGGGISTGKGQIELTNSIVALNVSETDNDIHEEPGGSVSITNCLVGTDPGFTDGPVLEGDKPVLPPEPGFSLKEGSPAIDAGTSDSVSTRTDFAGNPRIAGDAVDIGAYEFPSSQAAGEQP
ncbi:MAG: hypothetical protein IJG60_08055 [Thermoguttaceae bacterium]|nr:hypothetical protein [Thermoguttaceae bacterium]